VSFAVLNLLDRSGYTISRNVYWISPDENFTSLRNLEETGVDVKVTGSSEDSNNTKWTVSISNNSDKIAFFVRSQVLKGQQEILPSFWSRNYITLAPGETSEISVTCPEAEIADAEPVLRITGWNILPREIQLTN